ncbi:hypothetical protein TNCV_3997661 [Trichonephila clavipes]|nr:hypothetical protein TNCV_3997661 [Trichonephila clavipes]
MTTVDFLHHENPSTWAGVEPTTLGADGQRQANYATQSALAEFLILTTHSESRLIARALNRHLLELKG